MYINLVVACEVDPITSLIKDAIQKMEGVGFNPNRARELAGSTNYVFCPYEVWAFWLEGK